MGVDVYLYQGNSPVRAVTDPAGGTFEAAGDFDRLLSGADSTFPMLGRIDPHDDVEFDRADMPELINEIDRLLPATSNERERRGLHRLRALAELCAHTDEGSLHFVGD